jgi:hypothetical protein
MRRRHRRVLLEHRDRRRVPVDRDELREPRDARHGREPGHLAQERGHLEIGIEARLESSVRLEEEALTEHDARVALVRPEVTLRGGSGIVDHRGAGPADEGGGERGVGSVRPIGKRADRPPLAHRDGQRPPHAVPRHGFAQLGSGQPDRVALGAVAVESERHGREDVRRGRIEDERVVEASIDDRPTLGPEPAGTGERGAIEAPDRGRDVGS